MFYNIISFLVVLFFLNVSNCFMTSQVLLIDENINNNNNNSISDDINIVNKMEILKSSPPVLNDFNDLDNALSNFVNKNDKLILLLDYDGTLAPIAAHPDLTIMEPEAFTCLTKFTTLYVNNVYVAIISGRGVQDVQTRVGIRNMTFAGNHGLEINFANGTKYLHEISVDLKNNFTKMVQELNENLAKNGAWVENKEQSLTYHYRQVPIEMQNNYREMAIKLITSFGYKANKAHFSVEAKPPVKWNKGEAAKYILQNEFGKNWNENYRVIFAGDDTTDEDAMKILKGKCVSFRVSESENIQTYADYRLPSPKTVALLLKWLLNRMHV